MWTTASSAVRAFFHLHWIWHRVFSSKIPSCIISDNYENFAIKSKSKLWFFACSNELFQEGRILHASQSIFFDMLLPNWNMQVSSHYLRISLVIKHRLQGRFKYCFKSEFVQYRTISISNCNGMLSFTRSN